MRILVIRWGTLQSLPPAISLIQLLKSLNHHVDVLCNDPRSVFYGSEEPDGMYDLGSYAKVGAAGHLVSRLSSLLGLRSFLKQHIDDYEIVWTTSDNSAVYCCDLIPPEKHVMQLSELVEHVPLLGSKGLFASTAIIKQAQKAKRVVVPEINRAYIQRVYWSLPQVPCVLPNRPRYTSFEELLDVSEQAHFPSRLTETDKHTVLYQGVFTPDRNLRPYCEAVQKLGDEYQFCLMGTPNEYSDQLCSEYSNTFCIGRFEPPAHLLAAQYADLGVLPYSSRGERVAHLSPLNAIYCAPNKIWEYAFAGIPMIANELPGLKMTFDVAGIGLTVPEGDTDAISRAIDAIVRNGSSFRKQCEAFYASVDMAAIIEGILS